MAANYPIWSHLTYGTHRMTCGVRLTFDLPVWLGQQWSLTSQLTMQINPKPSLWFSNLLTYALCPLSQLIQIHKIFLYLEIYIINCFYLGKYEISFFILRKSWSTRKLTFGVYLVLLLFLGVYLQLALVFIYIYESRSYRSRGVDPEDQVQLRWWQQLLAHRCSRPSNFEYLLGIAY
jgi:hypothetical protein